MVDLAGRRRGPAWVTAEPGLLSAKQPARKVKWQTQFLLRCGGLTPEERQWRWGTTEHNQAELIAWQRVKTAMLTRLGRPEVRAGRAKFWSSEILFAADHELQTSLQAMLPKEATLGSITLGRWLKNGLVDAPIDGLVMRSTQDRNGVSRFWIEQAKHKK